MKKIVLFTVLFVLIIMGISLLIPSRLIISSSIEVAANKDGVYRRLSEKSNWIKWWPGLDTVDGTGKTRLLLGEYQFNVTKLLYNSFEIAITKNNQTDTSLLQLFSVGNDNIQMVWSTTMQTNLNPFTKLRSYYKAQRLKSKMTAILAALQPYVADSKNIYGIHLQEEKSPPKYLVATKKTFLQYPSVAQTYEIINSIKQFITVSKGETEGLPMVNVIASDSNHFEAQVAVSIKAPIAGNAVFSLKTMPAYAKFVVTEVHGGQDNITNAIKEVKNYLADYQKIVMASPFQLLVTDRSKEADTSKWVTKIYYPIR